MGASTGSAPALRQDVDACFDVTLDVKRFKDYGPNGLQVEGRAEVRRLTTPRGARISALTRSAALHILAVPA